MRYTASTHGPKHAAHPKIKPSRRLQHEEIIRKEQEFKDLQEEASRKQEQWRPLESKRCVKHCKASSSEVPGIILGYHHLSHNAFMLNVHVVPHCFFSPLVINCHLRAVLKPCEHFLRLGPGFTEAEPLTKSAYSKCSILQ